MSFWREIIQRISEYVSCGYEATGRYSVDKKVERWQETESLRLPKIRFSYGNSSLSPMVTSFSSVVGFVGNEDIENLGMLKVHVSRTSIFQIPIRKKYGKHLTRNSKCGKALGS